MVGSGTTNVAVPTHKFVRNLPRYDVLIEFANEVTTGDRPRLTSLRDSDTLWRYEFSIETVG